KWTLAYQSTNVSSLHLTSGGSPLSHSTLPLPPLTMVSLLNFWCIYLDFNPAGRSLLHLILFYLLYGALFLKRVKKSSPLSSNRFFLFLLKSTCGEPLPRPLPNVGGLPSNNS
uniref:Uncharacterized protein n=1 Tax=Podarcis muralis TaxID=64176 RepID=A0A670I4I8_PODMU